MKQMGKEAGKTKEWEEKEPEIVHAAMLRKFGQTPELREKLMDTGDKTLIEATTDKRWGSGLALNSSAMKRGECPGGNLQGIQLMRACKTLRKEMQTAAGNLATK